MDALLVVALVLGVVEGLTEFLPVSSTGHLILAGHALGFTDARADIFEVVIQAGAIFAVLIIYRERWKALLTPSEGQGFAGRRGLILLALTSLPALALGYLAHKAIKTHLFNPTTVALGLAVGAIGIFVVEAMKPRTTAESLDELTLKQAMGVGFFQCLALWPGMSRSASTILGGMILGVNRKTATEFSFFAALPIIAAATGYDLLKGIKGGLLHVEDVPMFAVGLLVSFLSAWAAVRLFIRFVATQTLRGFAIYRLILAAVVLAFPTAFGGQ